MIILVPETIQALIDNGALFVLNDSGGKDSQAMRIILRGIIPTNQLLVIHATLGDVEWPGALEHAKEGAEKDGIPFIIARAVKTFFNMVERRYETRPEVPCWPSASNRQCTSDLKRGPIEREIRRYMKARGLKQVVSCMGIRAEESPNRAKLETVRKNNRQSIAGRNWIDWLPIHNLKKEDVFNTIQQAGEKTHYAYQLGNDRLSCMFCIMASKNDLRNAAVNNPALYKIYCEMEEYTGYTMHMSQKPLKELVGKER